MRIDLGDATKIEVVFGGNTYPMREPTVKDIAKFQANGETNSTESFIDFVVGLGLPKDIAESMGVMKLKKLADGLLSEMQEKK
jgi:hypothetical protein